MGCGHGVEDLGRDTPNAIWPDGEASMIPSRCPSNKEEAGVLDDAEKDV